MHKKADYDGDQSYERDFHPPMSMLWRGHPDITKGIQCGENDRVPDGQAQAYERG